MQSLKRIPEGPILAKIPLEAAKAYPTRLFNTQEEIRFAYADISKNEQTELQLKLAPGGAKTSPHPQLIGFVWGQYHVERWLNYGGGSNPFLWNTWLEWHMEANTHNLNQLIEAAINAQIAVERKKELRG